MTEDHLGIIGGFDAASMPRVGPNKITAEIAHLLAAVDIPDSIPVEEAQYIATVVLEETEQRRITRGEFLAAHQEE